MFLSDNGLKHHTFHIPNFSGVLLFTFKSKCTLKSNYFILSKFSGFCIVALCVTHKMYLLFARCRTIDQVGRTWRTPCRGWSWTIPSPDEIGTTSSWYPNTCDRVPSHPPTTSSSTIPPSSNLIITKGMGLSIVLTL